MGKDKGNAGEAQHRGAGMGMNGAAALAAGRQAGRKKNKGGMDKTRTRIPQSARPRA